MTKIINLTISEQSAIVATKRLPIAGSKGLYKVHPIFDDEWSEITRKLIVFVWSRPVKFGTPKTVKLAVEYDGENDVTIPLNVINEVGTLTIGALGYQGEDVVRITTNADHGQIQIVDAIMKDSSEASGDSEDAIDIWAQVTAEIDELRTAIDDKADAIIAGAGIELVEGEISLAPATTETIGGVIIGDNLEVDEDGRVSAQPGIPGDARFWGQAYDQTNHRVSGEITLNPSDAAGLKSKVIQTSAGNTTYVGLEQGGASNKTFVRVYREDSNTSFMQGAAVQIGHYNGSNYTPVRFGGVATPTATHDAANKAYVDSVTPTTTSRLTNDGADGSDQYVECSDLANVEEQIPTTVAELTDSDDYATKLYVDSACSSVYRVKGSVATRAALDAITTKEVGDCYSVNSDNMNYVWTGTAWDQMAPTIDLSGYATTAYVDTALGDIESALATITTGTGA